MDTLGWIVTGGLLMSAIALVGGLTTLLRPATLERILLPTVAHEIPQEFGDLGVLVHGGWPRRRALLWNLLSALAFPLDALLAYFMSLRAQMAGLAMFAAGNFFYLAAADLIPELKSETRPQAVALNFAIFAAGLGLMLVLALRFHN